MSRRDQRQQKEKRREQRKATLASRRNAPLWEKVCSRAAAFIKHREWRDARNVLEEYEREHPGQFEVLRLLLDVYHAQREHALYCVVCRRLVEQRPDDSHLQLMLAGANATCGNPVSATLGFRSFLERWPEDPLADGVRQTLTQLQPSLEIVLAKMPFTGDDRLELGALHEQVLTCLAAADDAGAIRLGEELLARSPEFVSVMNNLSEAYYRAGQPDAAMAKSRRVLQLQPDNVHALSNLTRYLYLTGDHQEVEELARRLVQAPADAVDPWCKKCEALSFLGRDEEIRRVMTEAAPHMNDSGPPDSKALLHHLGAVACWRLGDAAQAEQYWRKALKFVPGFELAKQGVAEAARPAGQGHGPCSFPMNYWIRQELLGELRDSIPPGTDPAAVTSAARRFALAHPGLMKLVPALLDRGDKAAREFAGRLATLVATPEMNDVLRTFCHSPKGPDSLRMEVARHLKGAGVFSTEPVQVWVKGRRTEIELIGFEITREPQESDRAPHVDDLVYEAYHAMQARNVAKAAELFEKCIELAGEAPDLMNNLAATYQQLGRDAECDQLLQQVQERWPDYFFGQIAAANTATVAGDYKRSNEYLAKLRRRTRLHVTEFTALAAANIRLLLARDQGAGTRYWLDMWRQIEPDDPKLHELESLCNSSRILEQLRGGLNESKRKR